MESPAIEERDSDKQVLLPMVCPDLESPATEKGPNFSYLAGPGETDVEEWAQFLQAGRPSGGQS